MFLVGRSHICDSRPVFQPPKRRDYQFKKVKIQNALNNLTVIKAMMRVTMIGESIFFTC